METKNELEDNPQQYEQSEKELETHINDNFSTCSTPSPSKNEQEIINTIEEEIGKQLDEKAEKSNLTVVNVKNIIREVLTNEHMKLLFDKSLSADGTIMSPLYELRLTRARTKKLLSSTPFSPILNVPWVPQPDLKKKDSRDNCIPSKNESDDESNISETDLGSIPPSTPPTAIYSEDLVNPASYTEEDVEEKEVGGEVQELALNSSDVESDDGDDEEWIKFVENFTMPIEEISKPNEEEDQDPEYNILADDEMNEVDTEDFREDKAVKISKTEVKKLWEELFDCLGDISECGGPVNYKDKNSTEPNESPLDTSPQEYNNSSNIEINNQTRVITKDEPSSLCNNQSSNTASYELVMDSQQICIFTQQFRQHVQMLTQNFILTYQHPEYNHYSDSLHEYLLNLKVLSADKPFSWFKPTNLQPALDLIDAWIKMFASNTKAVKEAKGHIQNDLARSMAYKMAGNYDYVLTLPKLILETISKSEVFIYPFLLPKIPLKPVQFFKDRSGFTKAEDSLLVFGFHLFKQFLTEELMQKKVTMTEIVSFVQKYMMPHKNPESILRYIRRIKHPKYPTNPIKQYLQYGEIQPFTHYIHPFNYVVPPCRRMPNELPYQWRQFLYPNQNDNMMTSYTEREKMLLTHLIRENNVVEDKRTDNASLGEKRMAWELITTSYNSQPEVITKRTMAQLKKLWNNLKTRKRKMNTELRHSMVATGGGLTVRPVADPVLESVEVAAANLDVNNAFPSDSVALVQIEEGVVSGSPTEVVRSMEKTIGPSKSTPAGRDCKRSLIASVDIERKIRVEKVKRAMLQEQELHNLRKKILQEELLRAQLERQRAEEDFLRAQLERQRVQEDLLSAQLKSQMAADEAKPVENGQKLVIFNTLPVPVLSPILMTYTPENSNSSSLENIIALPSQNSSSTLVNTSFHNSSSISVLNNSAEDGSTVSRSAPINHFVSVFCRPISVQKLIRFLAKQEQNEATSENCSNERVPGNLNMPDLNTYVKNIKEENKTIGADNLELSRDNLTQQNNITKGMLTITNSENNRKERNSDTLELFTITSSCFQNNDTSTEVGFCRDSRVIQCGETIQCNDDIPSAGGCNSGVRTRGKDNKSGKKLLGAQKKMRDDFLATSEDPDTEKRENENFAVVYYDKLRETLEVEDYHSVMQVINDFTSGDVVDLYSDMEVILCPKYAELAEEFLLFLKEKEANAAKQLIPWLEVQVRIKFLRKLEMYLQDQPAQLKRIYSTLMELAKEKDVAKEKVKTNLLQFFKGNTILNDLFLECLGNDHHPASLTESSYGTMAMHKEMSMPVHEELFETFDECGESNSSCYCHRTEVDSDKRRYKHCHSCGLKFADKKLYLPTEKMFQPVTTNFKTNLNAEHNIRISGKSVTNHHKKKRSDNSPNELSDAYTTDDTKKDAGAGGINKCEKSISQQRPRKRRKIESTKCRDAAKPASLEKSHTGTNTSLVDFQPTTSPKKQTYFGEMPEQEELEKTRVIHTEQEIVVKVEPEEETEISLEPISYSDFEFIKVEGGCGLGNDDQQEKIPHRDYEFIKMENGCELGTNGQQEKLTDACMHSPVELVDKPLIPGRHKTESRSESPQERYESDDADSSRGASESPTDTKSIDESPWKREEDSIILEILQKENDKEYALKIISDNLPNRTVSQIRGRLSSLLALLSETLNNI